MMDISHFNVEPYLSALQSGELIVTANARLRRHILRAYGIHSKHHSRPVLAAPRIYGLTQLIEWYWTKLQGLAYAPAKRRIIDNMQRQGLWESIVSSSDLSSALLQPEALAKDADVALTYIELWMLNEQDILDGQFGTRNRLIDGEIRLDTSYDGNNTACFLTWHRSFNEITSRKQCITEAGAMNIIIEALNNGLVAREDIVHLAGFADMPPLQSAFLSALSTKVVQVDQQLSKGQVFRTEASSVEAEIRGAALWSQQVLQESPESVIGIIVPNLGQCRAQVERIFAEVFEPLSSMPGNSRYTFPFNFSAGIPLGQTPIIAAALDLLELNKSKWDLESICNILLSPFYGNSKQELVFRTHLITRLRNMGKFHVTTADLREHCEYLTKKLFSADGADGESPRERSFDSIHEKVRQIEDIRAGHPEFNSVTGWCDIFKSQLSVIGWPGTRPLDSQEYQQVEQWNKLMETFQLNSWDTTMSFSAAIRMLRHIAGKTPFQAKTANSPIQILGVLEADCLQFSHCWVMGLHHRQWPSAPEPNPLLPIQLQRQLKMPHSSAERELTYAKYLTENFSRSAGCVVFSSAQHEDDVELMPSALIRDIPLTPIESMLHQSMTANEKNLETMIAQRSLEAIDTAKAPMLTLDNEPVRGGAAIFKDQSLCPFNAFAKHRLGAIKIEAPTIGFSPSDRGNLMHEALATLWKKINNQSQLIAFADDALQKQVGEVTTHAVNRMCVKRGISSASLYARVEQERLVSLVLKWLDLEKNRPPFKVISIEQDVHVKFEGMLIKLRMDRVDQLENGDIIFIDYKTGEPNIRNWEGERMSEPQLPLYAVTANTKASAIAFAQVSAKSLRWMGTGELQVEHDGIHAGALPWMEQLEAWKTQLCNLAQSFINGDCRVDIKNPTALRYDEYLLPLNRMPEESTISRFLESAKQGSNH